MRGPSARPSMASVIIPQTGSVPFPSDTSFNGGGDPQSGFPINSVSFIDSFSLTEPEHRTRTGNEQGTRKKRTPMTFQPPSNGNGFPFPGFNAPQVPAAPQVPQGFPAPMPQGFGQFHQGGPAAPVQNSAPVQVTPGGMPRGGIFDRIASTPGILNATGARLNTGHYLVSIDCTKFEGGKRSGDAYIIEFTCLDGVEVNPQTGARTKTTAKGRKFSSVPKVKNAEVTVREIAELISALENRANGFNAYIDPTTGQTNVNALNFDITRTFHQRDATGNPTNPYKGVRVFVTAEKRTAQGSGKEFTRHEWSPASETLAAQYGYDWTGTPALGPGAAQTPTAPAIPAAPVQVAPLPAPMMPQVPAVPMMPPPVQVAPPPPPAPANQVVPPPQVTGGFPPGFVIPEGWGANPQFPGWIQSPPLPAQGVKFFNPSTGEVNG